MTRQASAREIKFHAWARSSLWSWIRNTTCVNCAKSNPSWRAVSVQVPLPVRSYSHSQNTLDLVSRKKSIRGRQSLLWCKQGIRSRKISRSNEFSHYSAPPMAFGVVLMMTVGSGFLDTQSRSTGRGITYLLKGWNVCGEEDIFIAEGRQIQTERARA